MGINSWDEIRTAFQVARIGTVSGAAAELGVHHATVIRHIDALEANLGVKLFQRHARGYQPTEAGEELLKTAAAANDQLAQMVGRIIGRSSEISGELIITTVAGLSDVLAPVLTRFQAEHPELRIRLMSDNRLFRLDYGEAHVALRAGPEPQEPDNVVQKLGTVSPFLCATEAYVTQYRRPETLADFANHKFIGAHGPNPRAPFMRWLRDNVPEKCFTFTATEQSAAEALVRTGAGIGFISNMEGKVPAGLVKVWKTEPEWESTLWLVSHVDLHRTPKVQAILKALKQEAATWRMN